MKGALLTTTLLCLASPVLASVNEIPDKVREACLPAADFAGCVKAFTKKDEEVAPQLDRFGMPIIEGFLVYDDQEENTIYYANPRVLQVNVRGMFGRYIYYTYVQRWYQEGQAGTAGRSTTIGSATTNCYNSGYGVSCTTTPPTTVNIPGRAAVAAGVRSQKTGVFIDCLDRTAQWRGQGKWESIEGTTVSQPTADANCHRITTLPKAKEDDDSKGSPNKRDLLAAKILPGSTPQQIRSLQGN